MKLHPLTYRNNSSKIIKSLFLIIFIFILSFKANTEIPEKYKIESSLSKCSGTDYKKWNNCYGEYEFPRIEYKGEWKNGNFHGQGVLKEAWGGIYIGDFKNNLADGFGKQEETDGTWWEGEVKNDQLNGIAIFHTSDGCSYEGFFKDNLLNGEGKITCKNGKFKKGFFKDDQLHGQGIEIQSNGTKFSGEFKKGLLNGYGEIEWNTGSKEFGNYIDDQLNGHGVFISFNGGKYEGNWLDGIQTGKGIYTWADGDRYEGNFLKNQLEGYGAYYYNNGNKYSGSFKDDSKHGKGIYTWADGDKYEGDFLNGNKNGEGILLYANGNKYSGNFKDDENHGKGVFTWADGDKYEGDWVDGWREGKGKYFYQSGTIYTGDFVKNYAEGKGTIIYSDGAEYTGEFKNGNEDGQGSITYPNGDKYVGQFKEAYLHGKGKMVYANGDIYDGLWDDGKEAEGKTTLAKHTTDEKYYALIIGNNNYDNLEDLDNAVNDAKDLEKVLKEKYGFETTLMIDKNKDDTHNAIINFTVNRKKNDNILIYYAGHGQLVKKQKRGYWLPTDAGSSQDSKWLSNNSIKDLIGSSDAKHILLIVDSCFSGSLMRGSGENKSVEKLTKTSIERLQKKKTRLVMTSGGNEQVADGIGNSKNSVFAEPLIKALKDNNSVIRSIELFQTVQSYVINNAEQTPNHSLIHGTGHNGGEFLFFPKS